MLIVIDVIDFDRFSDSDSDCVSYLSQILII
jgi:hypothetical protein